MKELIEKLKRRVALNDATNGDVDIIIKQSEAKEIIGFITSVKSENAEENQVKEFNYYPLFIQKKPYKALLSIQTSPFFKIIYKDKEITTDELCDILMELPNDEDKNQHAIGFGIWILQSQYKKQEDGQLVWWANDFSENVYSSDDLYNEYLTTL